MASYGNSSSAGQPPDGVGYSAGGGGGDPNSGTGALAYNYEDRWVGIANIDFQADRYNRLKIGGQYTAYSILDYSSGATGSGVFPITYENGHLSGGGHPVAYNTYAEDRLDLGDVVLVAGIRYDYYATKAWQWNEYPEISSRPGFHAGFALLPGRRPRRVPPPSARWCRIRHTTICHRTSRLPSR